MSTIFFHVLFGCGWLAIVFWSSRLFSHSHIPSGLVGLAVSLAAAVGGAADHSFALDFGNQLGESAKSGSHQHICVSGWALIRICLLYQNALTTLPSEHERRTMEGGLGGGFTLFMEGSGI